MKHRDDATAAAEAAMYQNALEKQGDNMDADTKAQFLAKLVSAKGQVTSARKRTEAEQQNRGNEYERF